jgi:deoxyribodipyrimidine photo-lyase
MKAIPQIRIRNANGRPVQTEGKYVLYWMNAFRRVEWNFSLQRAIEWSNDLRKPLLVLETVFCDYPWASDRIHQFVLDGYPDRAASLQAARAKYGLIVERAPRSIVKWLVALADRSCLAVADDFPNRTLLTNVDTVAEQIGIRLEVVDSNGLLPLRAADRIFPSAYSFRRFLQSELPRHFTDSPCEQPLGELRTSWNTDVPVEELDELADLPVNEVPPLSRLPIDHEVEPVDISGGSAAAVEKWRNFLDTGLSDYAELRNQPELESTSGLSPYFQAGHLSVHQVFYELMKSEGWSPARLSSTRRGQRQGWWGVGESAEGFLDELITWRELGYNMAWQRPDYDRFESLPGWAQETLEVHSIDPRTHVYSLQDFERAGTHDPLWNAAQKQLTSEGTIQNYLRMLWGKKILEWSASPRDALEFMIELNNKYALDGRNPNSYSGIFWVLGRYDRAWGPERPIFGKVRYMSSENTARKFPLQKYLMRYGTSRA